MAGTFSLRSGRMDGVLDAPLLQCLIDLRLGEGGVCSKHYLLAQLLSALNLRQQQFIQSAALCTLPGRSFAARQSP